MNRYMVDVRLRTLIFEQTQDLLLAEKQMTEKLVQAGVIEQLFVKVDGSGAYIVAWAEDEEQLRERLSVLPMFPYMLLTCTVVKG